MATRKLLLALPLVASMLLGCKKEEAEDVDLGYEYFPRKVGAWVEYQVDSIWRDDAFNVNDTLSYRLKEKVVEAYTDPVGRPAWRIHRFVKDAGDNWVIQDVWTSTKDAFYAEVSEENLRRLKLSFPVRAGRTWDHNIYNNSGEEELTYAEVDAPYSVNGLSFERTTLVESTLAPNVIENKTRLERYANGVGLISRYVQNTNSQPVFGTDPPYPFLGYEVQGYYFTMTAVDYGQD